MRAETLLASAGQGYGKTALFLLCCAARKDCWMPFERIGQLTLAENQSNNNAPYIY